MYHFYENALVESAIQSDTWFHMFEYLFQQLSAVEHPLRHPETLSWRTVFADHVQRLIHTELGNRKLRSQFLGHFLGTEKSLVAPANGESVGNIVTQVLPFFLGWLFYKMDQVRLDTVVSHYWDLRSAFEVRQETRASGLYNTRR